MKTNIITILIDHETIVENPEGFTTFKYKNCVIVCPSCSGKTVIAELTQRRVSNWSQFSNHDINCTWCSDKIRFKVESFTELIKRLQESGELEEYRKKIHHLHYLQQRRQQIEDEMEEDDRLMRIFVGDDLIFNGMVKPLSIEEFTDDSTEHNQHE